MADAATSDKFAHIRGFKIEIDGAGGKEVDTAWEHVSGGALMIEHVETTIAGDKHHTHSPGHKAVEDIVLRGAMTEKRDQLCKWINETCQGKGWKRNLTITELHQVDGAVKEGKQYIYYDCFPVRYVFPHMSVTHTTGNVVEEVHVKPIRCELK